MTSLSTVRTSNYIPPPHQAEVDALQAAMRAEAAARRPSLFKPAPPAPARSEDELDHRLAEELEFALRHLERIGAVLVEDPALLHRHGGTLQALDLVGQNLRHLASVISSADKRAAVERISLQELKRRLARKAIQPIGA